MARGNQRDKAREKTQKEAASSVSSLRPDCLGPQGFRLKLTISQKKKNTVRLSYQNSKYCTTY